MFTTPIALASALLSGSIFALSSSAPSQEYDTSAYDNIVREIDSTVAQGDSIYIEDGLGCTVGWVNERYAFTSGHCGSLGSVAYNEHHQDIGIVVAQEDSVRDAFYRNDWMVIELKNQYIGVGENIYNDGEIVSPQEVTSEDVICRYGNKTKKVTCSELAFPAITDSITIKGHFTEKGDSGGAVWVEGKGMLGLHSGGTGFLGNQSVSLATPLTNIPEQYLYPES